MSEFVNTPLGHAAITVIGAVVTAIAGYIQGYRDGKRGRRG